VYTTPALKASSLASAEARSMLLRIVLEMAEERVVEEEL
jgi:hypothetical protein